jgi:hypothetical protein
MIERRMNFVGEETDPYWKVYLESKETWYFISGFVTETGKFVEWAAMPEYMMIAFEYDHGKIKTDWDQIVRKAAP